MYCMEIIGNIFCCGNHLLAFQSVPFICVLLHIPSRGLDTEMLVSSVPFAERSGSAVPCVSTVPSWCPRLYSAYIVECFLEGWVISECSSSK